LKYLSADEVTRVRGEDVRHHSSFFGCKICGTDFWNGELPDPLVEAYRAYRVVHGLLDATEIRSYRDRLGLTQKVLAAALGMSHPTLFRYENGSLQAVTHDNLLRLAMKNPAWMAEQIISLSDEILPPKKRKSVLALLREEEKSQYSNYRVLEQSQKGSPSEFNGYTPFSPEKVKSVVLFLIKNGVKLKSCINKNMWYVDTVHYSEQGVSIMGLSYCRHNYGPIPDDKGAALRWLIDEECIEEREVYFPNGYSGYIYETRVDPDMSLFNEDEIETLQKVVGKFGVLTATDLTNITHEERRWKETKPMDRISFGLVSENIPIRFSV